MRLVHLILVIAFHLFQMSKTKLKGAPYWITVDILNSLLKIFHICLLKL